jgi:hypothetical protein
MKISDPVYTAKLSGDEKTKEAPTGAYVYNPRAVQKQEQRIYRAGYDGNGYSNRANPYSVLADTGRELMLCMQCEKPIGSLSLTSLEGVVLDWRFKHRFNRKGSVVTQPMTRDEHQFYRKLLMDECEQTMQDITATAGEDEYLKIHYVEQAMIKYENVQSSNRLLDARKAVASIRNIWKSMNAYMQKRSQLRGEAQHAFDEMATTADDDQYLQEVYVKPARSNNILHKG